MRLKTQQRIIYEPRAKSATRTAFTGSSTRRTTRRVPTRHPLARLRVSTRSSADRPAALECVDYVTIFPHVRAVEFLRAAQPAVYVKGGDYTPETLNAEERRVLQDCGAQIEIIPFAPGYSTSGLLAKIRDG